MRSTSLTVVIALFQLATTAQNSFTLEEAINTALKNNDQVKQANIDVEISRAKVKETTAIGLPQIAGEASMNYFIDIPTQVAEASTFDPTAPPNILVPLQFGLPYSATAGITASQLLFDGSYFVGLKASKAYLNYSLLGKEKTEIEVREQVAQLYFACVALGETTESLKGNKIAVDQSVANTNALAQVGLIEQQDADQMLLAQSNIQYQIDMAERQRQNLENMLKYQLGIPVDQPISLTNSFEELLESSGATAAVDMGFNIERHVDYRTVIQGEELSELSLSNQRAKYLPQLAGFFNHSQNGFGQDAEKLFSNDFYPTTIAGLQLNVPIFSSGMRYYQTQQAKLELEKVMSQKNQVTQSLQMQANTAQRDYLSALENLAITESNLKLAERIKLSTNAKYEQGMASSLDYAQSESQYLQTLATYINSAQEVFNAKLALNKAFGL